MLRVARRLSGFGSSIHFSIANNPTVFPVLRRSLFRTTTTYTETKSFQELETKNVAHQNEVSSDSPPSDDVTWVEIGNNSSLKDVRNIINEGKQARFIEGKYHNLLCLYRALKKKTAVSASPPYHKTKSDLYAFLLQRRVLQRDTLNKLQVEIARSNVKAEAQLQNVIGSDKANTFPKLPLDMQRDPSFVSLDETGSGFTSFHFLMAYRSCYQRTVRVKELGKEAELEVGFGVFPPTRKDYLRLFDNFFAQWCSDNKRSIHQKAFPMTVLDVGCGSGVLGFLTQKHLTGIFTSPSLRSYLLGVDQYHEAIRCATNNASKLEQAQNSFFIQSPDDLFPSLTDTPNSLRKRPLSRHIKALKNNEYDIIVCNPPWLPTDIENNHDKDEIVSFSDSYVYDDHKNNFLERFFAKAASHLKADGRIFLVHSNLGHLLGLYPEDYIVNLCTNNSLQIKSIFETKARVKFHESDWFATEKAASKVLLYEICHPQKEVAKERYARHF